MEFSKDANEYFLKTNFTDYHLTNLKQSCLKPSLNLLSVGYQVPLTPSFDTISG
jgi:hypothetical protein